MHNIRQILPDLAKTEISNALLLHDGNVEEAIDLLLDKNGQYNKPCGNVFTIDLFLIQLIYVPF